MTNPERISVGIRLPFDMLGANAGALHAFIAAAEHAGIDRVCVGDHVTFHGGQGFDGMIGATAVAALSSKLQVQTAVYLLPLRHPVAVARRIASLATFTAGRLIFAHTGRRPTSPTPCGRTWRRVVARST